MKITDLKVGDIVKTRDGNGHIVLSNNTSPNGLSLFSRSSMGCYAYLSSYDENMNHKLHKAHDIIAVYKASEPNKNYGYSLTSDIMSVEDYGNFNDYNIKWDWVRNEKKKMTVSEIEKILGYGVEIVSEN